MLGKTGTTSGECGWTATENKYSWLSSSSPRPVTGITKQNPSVLYLCSLIYRIKEKFNEWISEVSFSIWQ
jgi:hypothetical protein